MKIVDKDLMNRLTAEAKAAPRKRTHFNLHESLDDSIHRLCIAAEPETYMRAHRHSDKWELMIILRGAMTLLTFDNQGIVEERIELNAKNGSKCYELPAGVWHVFNVTEPGTIMMEVKSGPYIPIPDEDSANWAPAEGEEKAKEFEIWYRTAQPGDKF
jgi:cupin fold WbuC family metalloprotein